MAADSVILLRGPKVDSVLAFCSVAVLVLLLGTFRNPLAGFSYATGTVSGSGTPLLIALSTSFIFGFLLLVVRPLRAARTILTSWPIYVLPVLAIASATWSVDQTLTISRALVLVVTYVSLAGILAFFGSEKSQVLFFTAGSIVLGLSIIAVIVVPSIAIHQSSDAYQSVHAGSWRGVLGHRTALGQFSGLMLSFSIYFRSRVSRAMLLAVMVSGIVCLVCARSTGGYFTLLLGVGSFVILSSAVRFGLASALIATIAIFLVAAVTPSVLQYAGINVFSLIGKSSDLTGRTVIWQIIYQYVANHSWIGLGYEAGFVSIVNQDAFKEYYISFPNSQSGYVDLYVAFGLIGKYLVIISWAILCLRFVIRSFRFRIIDSFQSSSSIFGIVFVILIAQISIGESYIMESNNFLTSSIAFLVPTLLVLRRSVEESDLEISGLITKSSL